MIWKWSGTDFVYVHAPIPPHAAASEVMRGYGTYNKKAPRIVRSEGTHNKKAPQIL